MGAARPVAHFKTVAQMDVPNSRNGKHKEIVSMILRDLDQLKPGAAIKVPLADLGDSKENVRSALNRATRKSHPVTCPIGISRRFASTSS